MNQQIDKVSKDLGCAISLEHDLKSGLLYIIYDKGELAELRICLAPSVQLKLIEYFETLAANYM